MKVGNGYEQDERGRWWYRSGGRRWGAAVFTCRACGEEFPHRTNVASVRRGEQPFCSVSCASKFMERAKAMHAPPGPQHHNWKGGRLVSKDGYILVYAPDHPNNNAGYVFEHRLVMERVIGRYLTSRESVHHKNGVRDDNRPENLELWAGKHGSGQRAVDAIIADIEHLSPEDRRKVLDHFKE